VSKRQRLELSVVLWAAGIICAVPIALFFSAKWPSRLMWAYWFFFQLVLLMFRLRDLGTSELDERLSQLEKSVKKLSDELKAVRAQYNIDPDSHPPQSQSKPKKNHDE
jgi:hypothetical protein